MRSSLRLLTFLAATAVAVGAAVAQTAGDPGTAPPPRVQSAGGIDYVSGGAGEESRAAMARLQPDFPLRIVFSDRSGGYVVAGHVAVKNAAGVVFELDTAGPMLLVKLPPGRYTIDATYSGTTERRSVEVGREARTINWVWPVAPAG
ncbi:MAG: hypothetical protein ACXWJ1_09545 [Caldimonas sp.]